MKFISQSHHQQQKYTPGAVNSLCAGVPLLFHKLCMPFFILYMLLAHFTQMRMCSTVRGSKLIIPSPIYYFETKADRI